MKKNLDRRKWKEKVLKKDFKGLETHLTMPIRI